MGTTKRSSARPRPRTLARSASPQRARARVAEEIRRNAGKYVAIARDWSRVVAVGRTFREALAKARKAGFPDAAILLAFRDYSAVAF